MGFSSIVFRCSSFTHASHDLYAAGRRLLWIRLWAVYLAPALIILGPLLGSGYVLTLDMVFTPRIRLPSHVSSSYLFYALLHILNFVVSSDVLEKLLLFAIVLVAGVGMHRLMNYCSGKLADVYQRLGAYFAGCLFVVNPFTYDRFMAGQFAVLLGYAFLPWFVRS